MITCSVLNVITNFDLILFSFTENCDSTIVVGNLSESEAHCHLDKTCNKVDCCITVTELQTNIHIFFHIYTCELKLELGIERLKHVIPLYELSWGMSKFGIIYYIVCNTEET